jgi:hypothetical protein
MISVSTLNRLVIRLVAEPEGSIVHRHEQPRVGRVCHRDSLLRRAVVANPGVGPCRISESGPCVRPGFCEAAVATVTLSANTTMPNGTFIRGFSTSDESNASSSGMQGGTALDTARRREVACSAKPSQLVVQLERSKAGPDLILLRAALRPFDTLWFGSALAPPVCRGLGDLDVRWSPRGRCAASAAASRRLQESAEPKSISGAQRPQLPPTRCAVLLRVMATVQCPSDALAPV